MTDLTGKKVIVRSPEAGVFFGTLTSKNGDEVEMTNARCLWYWSGAASLNQLANEGVKNPDRCKFTVLCESIIILGVCEILLCTNEAIAIIEAVKEWKVE